MGLTTRSHAMHPLGRPDRDRADGPSASSPPHDQAAGRRDERFESHIAASLGNENLRATKIADLLARMRRGDRQAAADFITAYGTRVRRRIRGKLGSSVRRLFDSQEILSTVGRRLDMYVRDGKLEATAEDQLWALIFQMTDRALVDKLRVFRSLEAVEGGDKFARTMLNRLREAEARNSGGVEIEIDKALRALPEPQDREILTMWLGGRSLADIAEELGVAYTALRKRWQQIRERLRDYFEASR